MFTEHTGASEHVLAVLSIDDSDFTYFRNKEVKGGLGIYWEGSSLDWKSIYVGAQAEHSDHNVSYGGNGEGWSYQANISGTNGDGSYICNRASGDLTIYLHA